tara:strand:- start:348 stop:1328 length:981 start_codon:yes stop_codon:yes gene_type:complete
MKKNLVLIGLVALFFSCEKEELPISPVDRNNLTTRQIQIGLGDDYPYQVFYKLSEDLIVSQNLNEEWDLGFKSDDEGRHIVLNSSLASAVAFANISSFYEEPILSELEWRWDNPNGLLDSTAIGNYNVKENIYVIDRGYIYGNPNVRYKKMIIDTVTNNFYKIHYASLDNSNEMIIQLDKNKQLNFTTFSFSTNSVVEIQPNKEEWDLMFTRYTELFYQITPPPYLVTGVLINNLNSIQVAIDTINDFNNIEINFDSNGNTNYIFSSEQNIIGYDWKVWNGTGYIIKPNLTYVIKDSYSRYFKLRFIDFYNDLGEKGFPTFEVQEL